MRNMPVEHSKFIWDIVSYITTLTAFFDFAIGCGIPICTLDLHNRAGDIIQNEGKYPSEQQPKPSNRLT